MKIEKVKFDDVKGMICVRGEHYEIYQAVENMKKGEAIKVILDNPKSFLSGLVNAHYTRNKLKKDYHIYRLKKKEGWIVKK